MKSSADAILRTDQAIYLDALHATAVRALGVLAGAAGAPARDALLTKMEARAAHRGYPISDPEVACFLSIIARIAAPKLVVELGTNIGYGAIVMARASGKDSHVITVEYRSDLVEEARGYVAQAGLSDRIEVRHGMAIPELEKIEGPIDLLYIDCVKEEYGRYLEVAASRMAARGVVVADNVLWRGLTALDSPPDSEKARSRALRDFNMALVSRGDFCAVVLPLSDGIGFAVKI